MNQKVLTDNILAFLKKRPLDCNFINDYCVKLSGITLWLEGSSVKVIAPISYRFSSRYSKQIIKCLDKIKVNAIINTLRNSV